MKNKLLNDLKEKTSYKIIDGGAGLIPFYDYSEHVYQIFDLVIGDVIIKNYSDVYKKIKDKDISKLKLKEIIAYFTFIRRGERFCDGHISNFLDNGIFLKLYERYLEITSK